MSSVIVLNAHYNFCTEVSVQKAVKWFLKDKIEIILTDEEKELRSVELRIKVPVVVRLLNYVSYKIKSTNVGYSDKAVFNRDKNICQYFHHDELGKKYKYRCTEEETTIDHVLPRSRGGLSTFDNTVCCCRWHNERVKKNMTPKEAGMELLRKPVSPRQKKGDFAIFHFMYNPSKMSHKFYMEKWLKKPFSHHV